mmetsp:Transcript_36214/g.107375  ORF Transcript_36214/g.107375 Transcript_36214/m.107375 type:complete len:225 (+) Transcript_36214:779-1453(+)
MPRGRGRRVRRRNRPGGRQKWERSPPSAPRRPSRRPPPRGRRKRPSLQPGRGQQAPQRTPCRPRSLTSCHPRRFPRQRRRPASSQWKRRTRGAVSSLGRRTQSTERRGGPCRTPSATGSRRGEAPARLAEAAGQNLARREEVDHRPEGPAEGRRTRGARWCREGRRPPGVAQRGSTDETRTSSCRSGTMAHPRPDLAPRRLRCRRQPRHPSWRRGPQRPPVEAR